MQIAESEDIEGQGRAHEETESVSNPLVEGSDEAAEGGDRSTARAGAMSADKYATLDLPTERLRIQGSTLVT